MQGREAVRASFARQLAAHVADSGRFLGGAPTLIGEFGLPFDLDGGAAFRTGDFTPHVAALSSYYDALDANLAHATLWNYTPDNTNALGDGWNGEDLSIFSRDQRGDPADPNSGGRAVAGFCRPTVRVCAGRPRSQRFDHTTGAYDLEIEAAGGGAETVVSVPNAQYPEGLAWSVTSGRVEHDRAGQVLRWLTPAAGVERLAVRRGV